MNRSKKSKRPARDGRRRVATKRRRRGTSVSVRSGAQSAPNQTAADLIINGGTVVTMDATRRIIADGAVAVRGDKILAVGKRADINRLYRARRIIEARNDIITPGLIDAHNHPIHYLTKGAVDDMAFEYRFKNIIIPYEHALSESETYLNSCATFVEMISNGTTCFNDPGSLHGHAVGRAARKVGIRGTIAHETTDTAGGLGDGPNGTDWRSVLEKAEDIVETWDGAAKGRLRGWYSLNNPHRVTDALCLAVKERADARRVGIHAHVTIPKRVALSEGFKSPIRRYRDLGILGPNLYLIHLVHVVPEDVELLATNNVKAVHCPGRSLLGAGGAIAHGTIPEMIAAGVVMGLGSDAGAVSRFMDMVRQMYLAATAHKDARLDASLVGCYKAFEMTTIEGARAMLWDDEIGSLEAGKKADITIFDTSAPEMHPNPHTNPVANLVYSGSGSAAKTVVIDGDVVMEDKVIKTIDVPALLRETGKAAPRVLGHINARAESKWPIM